MIRALLLVPRRGLVLADCSSGGDPNHFHVDASCGANAVPQLNVIVGYLMWAAIFIAIIGLMSVAVKWAYNTHHGQQDNLQALFRWGAGCIILGSTSGVVNSVFGFDLFTAQPQAIPGLTMLQTWLNRAAWIAGILCAIGFLYVGIQAFRNHRNGEPIGEGLLTVTIAVVLVASASTVTYAMIP